MTHPAPTAGIHHVTAIVGPAQRALDFWVGLLGLRLVKRTVNFDDPGSYHFYFGDAEGAPGTLFTVFPWGSAPRGRPGAGQIAATALAIPPAALGFWLDRLLAAGVSHAPPRRRPDGEGGHETVVAVDDPDGLRVELVTSARAAALAGHAAGGLTAEQAVHAVRGVHGVTLHVQDAAPTGAVLGALLGFRRVSDASPAAAPGDTVRTVRYLAAGDAALGRVVDVVEMTEAAPGARRATTGVGTVHHVAFRAADDAHALALKAAVMRAGHSTTPVLDRAYFHSVYFREPGGVLFELATDGPGFLTDEPLDALGASLRLPPQFEARRAELEGRLPAIVVPGSAGPSAGRAEAIG